MDFWCLGIFFFKEIVVCALYLNRDIRVILWIKCSKNRGDPQNFQISLLSPNRRESTIHQHYELQLFQGMDPLP